MGVIKEPQMRETTGPECPVSLIDVFEKYRAIKFLQRETDDTIVIIPRDALKWQDLVAFRDVAGYGISLFEAEVIMG